MEINNTCVSFWYYVNRSFPVTSATVISFLNSSLLSMRTGSMGHRDVSSGPVLVGHRDISSAHVFGRCRSILVIKVAVISFMNSSLLSVRTGSICLKREHVGVRQRFLADQLR